MVKVMLKTNSKKASENIRAYILSNYVPDNYDNAPAEDASFNVIAEFIYNTFKQQYFNTANDRKYYKTEQNAFISWCAGLPSVLDTCYYYNRSAVDDLGTILEETDAEKAKFEESAAENLLSSLIYREIKKAIS